MEPLPYRHLYHAEIDGEGLSIVHRIMRCFRKAKPQSVERNWYYDVDSFCGFDMFLCKDADGRQYEVYGDWGEPKHPPLKIRHV